MNDNYHHRDETCPCPTCTHLARLLEMADYDDGPNAERWAKSQRDLAFFEAERDRAAAEALSEWLEEGRDDFRDLPMTDFETWSLGEP